MDKPSISTGESAFVVTSAQDIHSPRSRRLFDWWNTTRLHRAMPPYSAFDPVEHRGALGYLSVVSALDDGDYFYRIDGTEVVAYFGVEMSRRKLSDYPFPERRARIAGSFDAVKNARAPIYVQRNIHIENKPLNIRLLLLPFSDDAERVTEIMSCFADGKDTANLR